MATHSSVLAWRIPGMGKAGGQLSMGSHRVGHSWSDLAAAAYQSLRGLFPLRRERDFITYLSSLLPASEDSRGIEESLNLVPLIPSSVRLKENKRVSPSFLFLRCLPSGTKMTCETTSLFRNLQFGRYWVTNNASISLGRAIGRNGTQGLGSQWVMSNHGKVWWMGQGRQDLWGEGGAHEGPHK